MNDMEDMKLRALREKAMSNLSRQKIHVEQDLMKLFKDYPNKKI